MKQFRYLALLLIFALLVMGVMACASPQAEEPAGNEPAAEEAAAEEAAQDQPAGEEVVQAEPVAEVSAAYPEKPITLVIQASAGGGSDLFARTFANTVAKHNLLPVPIVPDNRPGGSGAVAFAYVNEKAGDPYYMLNASGSFVSTPIMGQGSEAGQVNYTNFTPIANLAFDEFVVAVKADSKYESLQDVVEAAIAEPDTVLAGGTKAGSPDSMCFYLIEKATGADFNYVVFDGGSEVNAALLGGHVDVAIGNPSDFLDLYQAGDVRVLGSFSAERLSGMPDVPTLQEMGYDVPVFVQNRGFVFPANVPDEAVQVLQETIKAYMETEEWAEYLETNMLTSAYLDSNEFLAFLEKQTELYTGILHDMGVIE